MVKGIGLMMLLVILICSGLFCVSIGVVMFRFVRVIMEVSKSLCNMNCFC